MSSTKEIANLLNEASMLSRIPRSGFAFLGSGDQSVAEHTYTMTVIAYALARLCDESVDLERLMAMCLFHDLPEARIGDLNYVQKKYVTPLLDKALDDISKGSSLGPEIVGLIEEYEKGETLEARLAHDADQLELLVVLQREEELGNARASAWRDICLKRIKTKAGKQAAESICQTPTDDWWCADKSDPHWLDGGKSNLSRL